MRPYLQHLEKTAAHPVVARAVEALVGAILGGGVGAGAGAITYKPDEPKTLRLPDGSLYTRKFTQDERSQLLDRALKGALIGGLVGGGATGGLAALMRRSTARKEKADAPYLVNKYLTSLRSLERGAKRDVASGQRHLGDLRAAQRGPAAERPGAMRLLEVQERITEAHRRQQAIDALMQAEKAQFEGFLGAAKKARARSLFGGPRFMIAKQDGEKLFLPAPTRHEGQILQHLGIDNPALSFRPRGRRHDAVIPEAYWQQRLQGAAR